MAVRYHRRKQLLHTVSHTALQVVCLRLCAVQIMCQLLAFYSPVKRKV